MRKNVIRFALSAMLLALCASADAQQPKKVPRIGYLSSTAPALESTRAEVIRLAAFELSATKILRDPSAIEPIGLYSLSGRFGNHRRRSDQARISLGLQPIIQSVARGSSLIRKHHLLIGIVLTNVVHKMFDLVRHVQRLKKSLVIGKRYRDTFLVHIESGKDIVVTRYEHLGSHRSASLVQWLNFRPLYLVWSARGEPRHPSYRSLRERGYIEGQNIAIEYRYTEGKRDRTPELAAELVRLKVDIIIVAGGPIWVQAVQNATKTIPIVMTGAGGDPVEAGLIESLARPGGNVTGVTNLTGELGGKRLELFKEAVPKLARVAVLYDPATRASALDVKEVLPAAARALRLTIQPWQIRAADGFEKVFAALNKERPDGLYVSPGPLTLANRKRIADLVLKRRLPSMYVRSEFVDAGGLMSYGADLADSYQRVAYYVDRILKGAKAADLPVEQPTKFEFVINLKTPKQIGVTINTDVLARATRIIR